MKHVPAMTFHTDDIPKWKQDLMQRKKSSSKTIVSAGGTVRLTVTRPVNLVKPLGGRSPNAPMLKRPHSIHIDRLVSSDSGEFNSNHFESNSLIENREDELVDEKIMGKYTQESLKSEKGKNSKVNIKLKINDEDYHSDSSDEPVFSEGVNAIRGKYLTKCSSSSPASNLEKKAISLEDICQIDSTRLKPKLEAMRKPCQFKVNQYQAKYLETIKISNNCSQNSNSRMKPVIIKDQIPHDVPETLTKNFVKQRTQLFETNSQIKVKNPSWGRSNTLTIIFKDRKPPTPEEVNEDISQKRSTFPAVSTDEKPALSPRPKATKQEEFPVTTKFSASNLMFPQLSSLENSQNAGQKTVACM